MDVLYGAALGGALSLLMILGLIIGVIMLVSMWKLFVKAGYAGWKALIPFYNLYILFEFTWGNGILFLLCLIPLANVVVLILTNYKLAVTFGQTAAFTIGLIFLSAVFLPILAFGPAEYEGVPTK